jgi:hypothetical protein
MNPREFSLNPATYGIPSRDQELGADRIVWGGSKCEVFR